MTEHSPYYVDKIVAYYLHKKEAGELADCFRSPTPANFRDRCVEIAHSGIHPKDHKALLAFFKKAKDANGLLAAIEKCDIDKFRPLQTFLKTLQTKSDEKNIDLLAWMIDYPFRPYDHTKKALMDLAPLPTVKEDIEILNSSEKVKEEDDNINKEIEVESIIQQPEAVQSRLLLKGKSESGYSENRNEEEGKRKETSEFKKKLVYAGITALLFITCIYFYPKPKSAPDHVPVKETALGSTLNEHQSCMYWAGDHYEQIPCNEKIENITIVPLDSLKLLHFKKITQLDTITKFSKKYVWYVKLNRTTVEFYTADGDHPLHPELRLRPITDYMIKKYVTQKQSSE